MFKKFIKIAVQIESNAENLPITLNHPRLRIKKEPMEESSEEQCKVEQQSTVTSDTTTVSQFIIFFKYKNLC